MTEGEVWVGEVLAELRAAGYRPRAWARFVQRSLLFARERRVDRSREHRATLALGSVGLAAWLGVGLAGRPWLAAAGAGWWIATALMIDWHLGMLEDDSGRRTDGLGPANALTFLRAGTPPAVFALFGSSAGVAILVAAAMSDLLDGWLARRRGETTRLGRWLDGSVDGLVIGAAALGAWRAGLAPGWLAGLIVLRLAAPWLVVTVATFARARTPDPRRLVSGRIPGLVLLAGLVLVEFDSTIGIVLAAAGALGGLGTFAATVVRRIAAVVPLALVGALVFAGVAAAGAPSIFDGWKTDTSHHVVPLREFRSGGPGKDGIPAIDHPRFLTANRVTFINPREPVIELSLGQTVRAYPIQILIWHEIVNDRVAGVPIAVTFCPLCNTAIVFDRQLGGRTLDFGTTGNLRDSDLVMYDRQTETWWQQFGGQGLVGRYAGARLRQYAARIVSWSEFRQRHATSLVLSRKTGFSRDYGFNPYAGYDDAASPPFLPTRNGNDHRLPPKERVVFVERGSASVAVPFSTLARRHVVRVTIGAHRLVIRATGKAGSPLDSAYVGNGRAVVTVTVTENGRLVPHDEPFWFAVAAFRPHVRIVR